MSSCGCPSVCILISSSFKDTDHIGLGPILVCLNGYNKILQTEDLPGGPVVKNLPCNEGVVGLIPG